MKIENNSINPISTGRTESVSKSEKGISKGKSHETGSNKDVANISDAAQLLTKTRVALDETSDIRSELVEDLRDKIANGSYTIPYEQLANILQNHIPLV